MKKSINTRIICKLVGSDYSAQEPRLAAFLSKDPSMYEAYENGKDLYAMIAQSAFDNEYQDNLEFYPEGFELELDGKRTVSGSGKEREEKLDAQNKVTINYYELLETVNGDKSAESIQIGEKILSDTGELTVINKEQNNEKITFTFTF